MRLSISFLLLLASPILGQDNWPQFRGSKGGVAVDKTRYPLEWDAKRNVRWQADIPGHGWSSPVVWGDRVFLTAVLNDKTPKPRKGLYIQDLFGKIPPGEHAWKLYCLDFNSGKILWDSTLHQGLPQTTIHLKNT